MAEWREEDHPRDELGRFTDKDGFYRANTPYSRLKDTIPLPDELVAEIHWYEEKTIGKVEFKCKKIIREL